MGAFLVPFAVSTGLNLITSLFSSKSKTVRAEEPNLSMPKSDLGVPIPFIYGRVRLSGNIFFPNKKDILYKVETTTTSSGGKGGGGRTKTERKDVYGTFAVSYCQCNTTLIELIINGLGYGPSSELFTNYCTFFNGSQTSPWSVISNRDESPYNQIAYKGISYIGFEDLPLAQFGNTVPQQMDVVIENTAFPRNPSLGGVVKDLCVKAGFTLGELDTTEIDADDLEQGIIVSQGGESYRDTLSELMQYYLFTAIETTDGKIAFKYFDRTGHSGATPVVVDPALFFPITEGTFTPKAFTKKVLASEDQALPEKITLSFYNENRRYNRDEVTEYLDNYSEATALSISVNIATYPYLVRDRLRKLIRYLSTQKRGSYNFELPMTLLSSLNLLSIVQLPNGELCQIYQIVTGNNYTLKITAQFYSGTTSFFYNPINDDDLGNIPNFVIPSIPNLYILDIVNIADYPPSTLYCLSSTTCALSVSADNNQSEVLAIDHLRISTIGDVLTTGLPNVVGLDLVNTIDISLTSGSVETITQTQFDTIGNDNLALLGKVTGNGYYSGKLIKFKTVTVLTPTTFRLSYLYQGMLGTESFDTSSLPLKFFLLRAPTTAYYSVITGQSSFIGRPIKITPIVSSMQNIGSTPVTTVTPIGNAYRPPSPTNLVDLKDSQDNIKLVWDYNPVISAYDNTQVDISYDIEIYNGVTLVRTLTTTNKEIVYTKTLRTSDGLGLSFPVKIYGVSSVGGRGIPLSETISPILVAGAIFTTGNTLSGIRIITGNDNALASDDGGVVVLQTASAGTFTLTFSATLPYGFSCYVVNDRNNNASTILNSIVPSTYSRLLNYELVTGSASIVVHISEGTYFTVARNLWLYTFIPVSVTGTILYAMRYWSTAVTATSVLLTPDPNRGDVIGIGADNGVNYANNNLTINGNGFNIEGSATYVFNQNGERGLLYFTGTEWRWLDRTKAQGDMLRSVYDTNLDGIVDNSALLGGQNSAFHLARTNHTGTQLASTVSNFSEAVDDRVAALIQTTTSILNTYNDAGNTLSLTVIPEFIQDTVASFTLAGNGMTITYDDTANTLTVANTDTISNTVTSGTPYTLLSTDRYKWIRADGTMTVTVGTQSSGFECIIQNIGTGTITISGVANAIGTKLVTRWTACHVYFNGTTWTAVGALTV